MQTNRAKLLKLTAGAVTIAIALTACQSRQPVAKMNAAIGKADVAAQPAALLTQQSETALAAGNAGAAVSFAELAVSAEPRNADARVALAKAYVAAGRFQSASEAYGDVAAMRPDDSNARFRSALAELAKGNRRTALAMLESLAETPSVIADVGLAFALAGETDRAVDLLVKAVRGGGSTPRIRQNLALAQALAGEWSSARVTASMDLTPDVVNARVAEWAALASNKDAAWRVATVLGVAPAETDTGRPVRLAWSPPAAEPVQLAAMAPEATPARPAVEAAKAEPVFVPPVVAAAAPVVRAEPVRIATAEVPAVAAPKPLVFAGKKPATAEQKAAVVKVKTVAPTGLALKPVVAVKREIRALPKPSNGAWVVQLGSYAKPEFLNAGWQGLVQKNKSLGDYKPLKSSADVKGATYHRLAVGSFATVAEAVQLCQSLKAGGQSCFVRKGEGSVAAPVAAARKPKRA